MTKTNIDFNEKELYSSKSNVIFECDNKYPLSVENVINVFKVINKNRKDELNLDLKTIATKMINYYNVNEEETRRCIASLYLDGAINIVNVSNMIYFTSNFKGKRHYSLVLKEKICLNILTNICKMYVNMNLIIEDIASDFSLSDLLNYLIKEDVKIQRITLTETILFECLKKLCCNNYLKKNDSVMYTITNKTIKFGQKLEDFNKYCKNLNIQTIYRQRKSSSEKTLKPNNFIKRENCNVARPTLCDNNNNTLQNLNIQFGVVQQNAMSNFVPFEPMNIMLQEMVTRPYNSEVLTQPLQQISFIPHVIRFCNLCGQGPNEYGNILHCNDCNIEAHVLCKQFFNCSKAIKWCASCRYPFQVSIDNGELVDLLCQECFNQRQYTSDMCGGCLDESKLEIVQLESFENILPKNDHASSDQTIFKESAPNPQSFVDMLNESDELSPTEVVKSNQVNSWTLKDVEKWLIEEGYHRLCLLFRNEEIDGKSLLLLVEEDLRLMKLNEFFVSELYEKIKKLK